MSQPQVDIGALAVRYATEKDKRTRSEANEQYIELDKSEKWKPLAEDIFADHAALDAAASVIKDGEKFEVLVIGAGYGGLQYSARLIEAGVKPEDIRHVDVAGGFGGTWYWNRYPGIMCDVESYTYMPLLEETGYMPKWRYCYGAELREYAELIAKKYGLQGMFRTKVESCTWDDTSKRWVTKLEQSHGPGKGSTRLTVHPRFVINANGTFTSPKAPRGLEKFEGTVLHTAYWDYNISGGSQTEPALTGLEGKRVGIIGTGATAVQLIPHLGKWSKELYVFQRTPSAVGERGQRPTDPEEFKTKIATGPGWHNRRIVDFALAHAGVQDRERIVSDEWTNIDAYHVLVGGPHGEMSMDQLPAHIGGKIALDYGYSNKVRERVSSIVKDEATAEKLKAWYPSWCKRPTFHDDYLPTFNLPTVHLVDTDGKGVSGATAAGLLVGETEYPVDILVLATGYRSPAEGLANPALMSHMTFIGRGGLSLSDKWEAKGPSTVHGVLTHDFPNLLLTGPMQAGATGNFVYSQDLLARHIAYLVKQAGPAGAVEATPEGEEMWAGEVMKGALTMAALSVCLPSYANNEGLIGRDESEVWKVMRGMPYSQGALAFRDLLGKWREDGKMEGVVVH